MELHYPIIDWLYIVFLIECGPQQFNFFQIVSLF